MKTIEEIINRHFATEKELDIIRIPPKFDFQNENQYFEVKGEMNYFVKIKKNLKKEFVNNKILEPLIRVPHIYEYTPYSFSYSHICSTLAFSASSFKARFMADSSFLVIISLLPVFQVLSCLCVRF